MQFSTLASVLTMAVAAIAAPADTLEARTGGSGGGNNPVCSAQNNQVCCNGILGCAVQVLGSNCDGSVYCCETNAPAGALVNVVLLNCAKLL